MPMFMRLRALFVELEALVRFEDTLFCDEDWDRGKEPWGVAIVRVLYSRGGCESAYPDAGPDAFWAMLFVGTIGAESPNVSFG